MESARAHSSLGQPPFLVPEHRSTHDFRCVRRPFSSVQAELDFLVTGSAERNDWRDVLPFHHVSFVTLMVSTVRFLAAATAPILVPLEDPASDSHPQGTGKVILVALESHRLQVDFPIGDGFLSLYPSFQRSFSFILGHLSF